MPTYTRKQFAEKVNLSIERIRDLVRDGHLIEQHGILDSMHPTNRAWMSGRRGNRDTHLNDVVSSKHHLEKVKLAQEVKLLKLQWDKKRELLVSRDLVIDYVNKLDEIDVKEFNKLGDRSADRIFKIFGIQNQKKLNSVKDLINIEVSKILKTKKEIMNQWINAQKMDKS